MTPNRRKTVFLLLVSVIMLGFPFWLMAQEVRQEQLNRDLIAAIKDNDTPAALSLLARGADPDARYTGHRTMSVWQHFTYFLHRLRGKKERAPTALILALASEQDQTILVKALLDKGAAVNVTDEYGWTPLLWAILWERTESVTALLNKHANVNVVDENGEVTPLSLAASQDSAGIVKILLERGAVVNYTNRNGETALSQVDEYLYPDVVRLLERADARGKPKPHEAE